MSDSAERLDILKPNFSPRMVPTVPNVDADHVPSAEIARDIDRRNSKRSAIPSTRRSELPAVRVTEDKPRSWLDRLTMVLPGWLVSLLIHMLIILCMASVLSLPKRGIEPVALVVAMTEAEDSSDAVSVEFALAEDVSESEEITEETLEMEMPAEDFKVPDLLLQESLTFDTKLGSDDPFEEIEAGDSDGGGEGGGGKASAAAKSGGGKGTTFFGIESKGDRFVYIVDCSGSMSEEYRYRRAAYELERSLSMLEDDQEFLVALYNDRIFPMLGMSLKDTKLIKATDKNRDEVIDWMKAQQPSGFTLPARAMYGSLMVQPDAIFLLSDGELGDDTVGMLREANRGDKSAGAPKIPVHTITIGSTGAGLKTMKTIAKDNEGHFVWVR